MTITPPPPEAPAGQSPDPSVAFPSLDQLAADIPPVAWLWPGWIPRGMITLLCAAPGAGKSYFALDLAHRLIAGLPWPDDTPSTSSTPNVIYVDAEAAPQLLNARALAWGMDRSHLFPMLAQPLELPGRIAGGAGSNGVGTGGVLDLNEPACQARLLAMAAALHPALVIVDSLGSASRGVENQVSAIDDLFSFFNGLAVQYQCGMLLIHHLRKRGAVVDGRMAGASLTSDDVRGSGHIVSLARSVLGLAAIEMALDPEPNASRRLQLLKTNLGSHPAPLGVMFRPSAGGGISIDYGPAPEPIRRFTVVESCARWLLDVLAEVRRPVTPTQVVEAAQELGFSRATVFRAREFLGSRIADTVGRNAYRNRWVLPEFFPPPEPPPEPIPPAPSRPKK